MLVQLSSIRRSAMRIQTCNGVGMRDASSASRASASLLCVVARRMEACSKRWPARVTSGPRGNTHTRNSLIRQVVSDHEFCELCGTAFLVPLSASAHLSGTKKTRIMRGRNIAAKSFKSLPTWFSECIRSVRCLIGRAVKYLPIAVALIVKD